MSDRELIAMMAVAMVSDKDGGWITALSTDIENGKTEESSCARFGRRLVTVARFLLAEVDAQTTQEGE